MVYGEAVHRRSDYCCAAPTFNAETEPFILAAAIGSGIATKEIASSQTEEATAQTVEQSSIQKSEAFTVDYGE